MMHLNNNYLFIFIIVLFCYNSSYSSDFSLKWSTNVAYTGNYSSPRSIDLDGDGLLEVVISCSYPIEEMNFQAGTFCLNGVTGEIIWEAPLLSTYMYGTASFLDVNNDDVLDIFIVGGFGFFNCINGATGDIIWEFDTTNNISIPHADYNFFNPKIIPDQNSDNISDILISHGGNANLEPYSDERKTGYLLILNSVDGTIISLDSFPDSKETYFSPIVVDINQDSTLEVIYGTGGETDSGSLWKVSLSDLKNNDIHTTSSQIDGPYNKGFLQPCTLADFNNDGYLDILSINLDGSIKLIDVTNNLVLWEENFNGFEIYTEPTILNTNNDDTLEVFIRLSKGIYNDNIGYDGFKNLIFNSISGDYYEVDTFGYNYQFNSALSYWDENSANLIFTNNVEGQSGNKFTVQNYNIESKIYTTILDTVIGSNTAATPVLRDVDNDGLAELVISFEGIDSITINCYDTDIKEENVTWASYYGNNRNSIYTTPDISTSNFENKNKALEIYPSITKQIIQLPESVLTYSISIYNTKGQLVLQKNIDSYSDLAIDIGYLENGLYIIEAFNESNSIRLSNKVIKIN